MPYTLATRTVVASYFAVAGDGSDSDTTAELAPLSANVRFYSLMDDNYPAPVYLSNGTTPIGLVPAFIDAKLVNGKLLQNDTEGCSLHTFREMPLRWRVEFTRVIYAGVPLPHGLKPFAFDLPYNSTPFNLVIAPKHRTY